MTENLLKSGFDQNAITYAKYTPNASVLKNRYFGFPKTCYIDTRNIKQPFLTELQIQIKKNKNWAIFRELGVENKHTIFQNDARILDIL